MPLYWEDAEAIADALLEAYLDQDPSDLTMPTLDRMICDLADFADDPGRSSGAKLDAIRAAWVVRVNEVNDAKGKGATHRARPRATRGRTA